MPSRPSVADGVGEAEPARLGARAGEPDRVGGALRCSAARSRPASANSSWPSCRNTVIVPLASPPPVGRSGISSATCGCGAAASASRVAVGVAPSAAATGSSRRRRRRRASTRKSTTRDDREHARDQQRAAEPRRRRRSAVAGRLAHGPGARRGRGRRPAAAAGWPAAPPRPARPRRRRRPGDLGQRRPARRRRARRHAARPGARRRGLGQQAPGRLGVGVRLLAEQVVRQRPGDLARQPVGGRQRGEAGLRAGADGVDGDAEQRGDLVVRAPLLEHERRRRRAGPGRAARGGSCDGH